MKIAQLQRKYRNILRTDLVSFIAKSFTAVNPSSKFLPNWHINLIAEALCQVEQGNIRRLIINMPPRYLKSLCISIAWPAWILGHKPESRIMVASYSQLLSNKHSTDCRLVILSDWYKKLFPRTIIRNNQNTKNKFATEQNGFRFATSVQGTVTGEGGNFLIVDDPHNYMQINSITKRQKVKEWFEQAFISRLDNKNTGAIIIVMQRFHEDDLTGYLLKKASSPWYCLQIPAMATTKTNISLGKFKLTREAGEILHAEREDKLQLKMIKDELGDYCFSAQYLQTPISTSGNMIKLEWIKRYQKAPNSETVIQSWDTAIKVGENNNYSVCTTWAVEKGNYYLINVCRLKLEYPELKKIIVSEAAQWQATAVLIEDKSSGQSLLQDLKSEDKLPLIAIKPILDKVTRFASISTLFEAGRVLLPLESKWLMELEHELLAFPLSNHDDQVDSISQFLSYIRKQNYQLKKPIIRRL